MFAQLNMRFNVSVQIFTESYFYQCIGWNRFYKTLIHRNPTPNKDGVAKVTWEPMGNDDNYLDINLEPTMKKGMLKDRVSFWADIYKNVLGDYSKLFA